MNEKTSRARALSKKEFQARVDRMIADEERTFGQLLELRDRVNAIVAELDQTHDTVAALPSQAFPKFESYGMSETAAFRRWKAQNAIEWFHGIGRLDTPSSCRGWEFHDDYDVGVFADSSPSMGGIIADSCLKKGFPR